MRILLCGGFLLAGSLAAGCGKSDGVAPPALTAAAAGCNVLLITLGTARADHLGCYGHVPAVTPALDELARRGVRFDQAFSHAPITLPSNASLLTGTRPPEHGVRDNGRFALGPELPTLAEQFRTRGYRTGAFISAAVLAARYGLNRGFDTYHDEMPKNDAGQSFIERHAGMMTADALNWLNSVQAGPFFCWVHYFDPHAPYVPPPQFAARAGDDPYLGEISFADSQVGRLLTWLEERQLRGKTLVIVMCDHGESRGDHGYDWHALLVNNGTMRVALLFSLPGRLPEGQVRAELAAISDVMPTTLGLMGWPVPETVTGTSLLPALAGLPMPARAIYGESEFPFYSFGWSRLQCLVTPEWKYIRAPKPELYDRGADPRELVNLAAARPEVVTQLDAELAALEASITKRDAVAALFDPEQQRALQSLGYAGATPTTTASAADLKNPRDMIDVSHDYRIAESLAQSQRIPEAIPLLEPAFERSPESFVIARLLGNCYGEVGRLEESQQLLMHALTLFPESADTQTDLAVTLGRRGRFTQCLEFCQRALTTDPQHDRAPQTLGWVQPYLARQEAEIAGLRRQVASNPGVVNAVVRLAEQLVSAGKSDEAVAILRTAAERQPDAPAVSAALASLLATAHVDTLRDGETALRLAEAAHAAAPSARTWMVLAAARAECGRFPEAAEAAQQALAEVGASGDAVTVNSLRYQLKQYQAGRPYHELP